MKVKKSTVMFLPSKMGEEMLKKMRENEDRLAPLTGFRISYSEASGTKLAKMFSTDLSLDQPCGRILCKPCESKGTETSQNCRAKSILYESSCKVCNPVTKKPSSHQADEVQGLASLDKGVADPSLVKGRVGIYLGETSRSLFERTSEHFNDAKKFSPKSHMVKHWMNTHPEMNTLPPFKIKIIKQYRDCLSRQLGEAIAIYVSKDTLLNGKNEYLNNCISRVTIQEGSLDQKMRLIREEQEEKKELEDLIRFKEAKTTTNPTEEDIDDDPDTENELDLPARKMKRDNLPEGGTEKPAKKRKISPEVQTSDFLDYLIDWRKLVEELCLQAGRLEKLRERMKREKEAIIAWMANKVWMENITDAGNFFQRLETEYDQRERKRRRVEKAAAAQSFYRERIQPTVLLNGWLGWWDMAIESCLKEGRKRRVLQAEERKEFFTQRILPDILLDGWSAWWNIMEKGGKRVVLRTRIPDDETTGFHLVGWRGWWSRMEAEGKREAATMSKLELLNIQNAKNRASSIKRFFLNNKEAENKKQAPHKYLQASQTTLHTLCST